MRSLKNIIFGMLIFISYQAAFPSNKASHLILIRIVPSHRYQIPSSSNSFESEKEKNMPPNQLIQKEAVWNPDHHLKKITLSSNNKVNSIALNETLFKNERGFVLLPNKTQFKQNDILANKIIYTITDL